MTGSSNPLFARLYDRVMEPAERTVLEAHRRYLAEGIDGSVLDVGAGTGRMFPYFVEAADEGADLTAYAVEPDAHMRRRAAARARDLGLDVELSDASAEALPFDDDSFDFVVASLVFCTIGDVEAALAEVARVLKPGGEFRFLEHVRGDGTLGVAHDVATPGWRRVAGGCHLNRETGRIFLADDRFELLEYTRLADLFSRFLPVVRGRLERRGGDSLLGRLARGRP